MTNLLDRVNTSNEVNSLCRVVVPQLIELFKNEPPRVKKTGELFAKDHARAKELISTAQSTHNKSGNLMHWLEVSPYGPRITIHVKSYYSVGEFTVAYITNSFDVYHGQYPVTFDPNQANEFSLPGVEAALRERKDLQDQIEDLHQRVRTLERNFCPVLYT